MDVADDIERAVLVAPIRPEPRTCDASRLNLLGCFQGEDVAEALAFQPAQRAAQILELATNDVRAEVTVGTCAVALLAEPLGQIENDRYRQHMELARQRDQWLTCLRLPFGGAVPVQ